ncbi:MAG TPA: alpha-1,4-glucan--maltose-1-phosphate maltosyltransferase [Tepidiformaceae bacterium]|nr:alpha-1,4-glucan--maltose-1-phosphate maltosyltransferase [Tepidiformaceae bacterium]
MTGESAGYARPQVESVLPAVDGGRFPVKRCIDESLTVTAIAFTDGHDRIGCTLLYRGPGETEWRQESMRSLGNDHWEAEFAPAALGRHEYTVEAWLDPYASWQDDLARRSDPDDILELELQAGANLLLDAATRLAGSDAQRLHDYAERLTGAGPLPARIAVALSEAPAILARKGIDRSLVERFPVALPLVADPPIARFGAWYEFFPRSARADDLHATFADACRMLDYAAAMGFDIVYLPPIHPIGETHRKGKNNARIAQPDDTGSPWAIGAPSGGHTAVHTALGTLTDFDRFVTHAHGLGLRVAIDIAFQCSPDHPLVSAHPDWFRHRPDGSIRYAENPPKRYEDIVPFDFASQDWRALWDELRDTILFWVQRGIRILRVDNPHTKPLPFWEWCISEVKSRFPDVVFLAEAFTRPAVLEGLARRGFSQSYTYFTWRNTRFELEEYLTELTQTPVREYLRPNLWPNTPDILHEFLQSGGRAAFMARFVLAATLGSSYGIYGPAFELCEATPVARGSEEYLDSEKYQLRTWDLDATWSLRDLITRVNAIRHAHPALQFDHGLRFHPTDNDQLICYSKVSPDGADAIVTVVNLDPHHRQYGHVDLDLQHLGVDPDHPYQVHDLLGDGRYLWIGPRNYVELDAGAAHIFAPRTHIRTEQDFDYFL